ncbi:MAG: NADH-quinone oxidoreductase subunit K [Candidatus Brocadiia bacterium]|jgi:multisubunit Na+/H+ antiporter MnhC subunit
MPDPVARLVLLCGMGIVLLLIVGFYSLLTTRNLVRMVIALEILSKATTLALVASGYATGQYGLAQALAITLIVIEVAVVVVAVAIILCVYKHTDSLDVAHLRELKG